MNDKSRRSALKGFTALPIAWITPVVQIAPLPAHAATSDCNTEVLETLVEFSVSDTQTVGSFTFRNNGGSPVSILGVSFATNPSMGNHSVTTSPPLPIQVAPGVQVAVQVTITGNGVSDCVFDATFVGHMLLDLGACGDTVVNVNGGCPNAIS